MRLALIENNKVTNVVIADIEFAQLQGWNYIELADGQPCEINWTYDGTNFIRPVVEETPSE